jgi:hypothetical protein
MKQILQTSGGLKEIDQNLRGGDLFVTPVITTRVTQQPLGVSHSTALSAIRALEEAGSWSSWIRTPLGEGFLCARRSLQ